MKSHGCNYTSPAELRQRGVLTNLHKIVCAVLSKITLDDLRLLRDFPLMKIHLNPKYEFQIKLFHSLFLVCLHQNQTKHQQNREKSKVHRREQLHVSPRISSVL